MLQPFHSEKSFGRRNLLPLAIVLAVSGAILPETQAARVGHARVISAEGRPLHVVIPFLELTNEDLASLQVSLADEGAWRSAGLQPPVPLKSLSMWVEAGPNATTRYLRVKSTEPLRDSTVDLLFNMGSSTAQRQVQISFLLPSGNKTITVAPAELPSSRPAKAVAENADTVTVKEGDTLFDIARRHSVGDATHYQILAALLHQNPQAFAQGNMNLLKAGAELSLPDRDRVLQENPELARELYKQQTQAYAEYRARLGAQVATGASIETGRHAAKGKVSEAQGEKATPQAVQSQDRVRLDNDKNSQTKEDLRASEAKALKDAEERVATLQSNVEALNKMAGKSAEGEKPVTGHEATGKAGVTASAGETKASTVEAATPPLSSEPNVTSSATSAAQDSVVTDTLKDETDAGWTSSLPAWLVDNLLVLVTAALALIAFIFAWLLRRAGARRQDEDEVFNEDEDYDHEDYASQDDGPALDDARLNRKLDDINLDLDQPPSDESQSHEPHQGDDDKPRM